MCSALRMAEELQEGDNSLALSWVHRAVELAPLDEPSWRKLIALQVARGAPAAALGSYRRLSALLLEECGTTPAPETRALVAELLNPGEA